MNIDTRPPTLGTVIKVILFIAVCILLAALTWHADAQDTQRITAITCLQGDTFTIDEALPAIRYHLSWDKVNGWQPPREYRSDPSPLNRVAGTVALDDGSEMLITVTPWYSKRRIAYGLWWYGLEPDWRNIGDGNPHPPRMVALNVDDVDRLVNMCREQSR